MYVRLSHKFIDVYNHKCTRRHVDWFLIVGVSHSNPTEHINGVHCSDLELGRVFVRRAKVTRKLKRKKVEYLKKTCMSCHNANGKSI